MCLHLDHAGRSKAGRVIWLPEMPQEQLNVLCLAMFVAISRQGVYRSSEDAKGVAQASSRLYEAFERRAESIETFLGGSTVKALMPRQSLSNPVHVASLLVRVQREAKLKPSELAARVDGMRLLPNPKAFESYIDKVSRLVTSQFPVPTWTKLAEEAAQRSAAAMVDETSVSFDAEPALG
ncbi:hypothetical protein [Paucibacter soli]|uniref:hypothetical protein n=1 Tax=Paucibacter soli TaxID=3133433 RepID=UPI0030ABF99D